MFISMHSIHGWVSFCMNYCINAAWHGDNQPVSLLRCNRSPGCFDNGLQVFYIVGSGVSHPPLDKTHIFSMGSGLVSLLANQAHQHHGHWTSFWYLWQCGQVPCPAGKWNLHLHKACQQKEAWSALKFPGRWLRWLWTSENTVDQHQQMTWQPKSSPTVETLHWTSSNMNSVSLHSSSRLWDLDFQMKYNIYFYLKRGLWTKSAVFPIIVVSKNKRYLEFILYGWPFIETHM